MVIVDEETTPVQSVLFQCPPVDSPKREYAGRIR
jgi:hypothetical protein